MHACARQDRLLSAHRPLVGSSTTKRRCHTCQLLIQGDERNVLWNLPSMVRNSQPLVHKEELLCFLIRHESERACGKVRMHNLGRQVPKTLKSQTLSPTRKRMRCPKCGSAAMRRAPVVGLAPTSARTTKSPASSLSSSLKSSQASATVTLDATWRLYARQLHSQRAAEGTPAPSSRCCGIQRAMRAQDALHAVREMQRDAVNHDV